jgi:hypothetical protein
VEYNDCVIVHNMVIESERADLTFDTQGPLVEIDHARCRTSLELLSPCNKQFVMSKFISNFTMI